MTYLIVFRVESPVKRSHVYNILRELGEYIICFNDVVLLDTDYTVDTQQNHLVNAIGRSDSLFITRVNLRQNGGYLNSEVWDWLEARPR